MTIFYSRVRRTFLLYQILFLRRNRNFQALPISFRLNYFLINITIRNIFHTQMILYKYFYNIPPTKLICYGNLLIKKIDSHISNCRKIYVSIKSTPNLRLFYDIKVWKLWRKIINFRAKTDNRLNREIMFFF